MSDTDVYEIRENVFLGSQTPASVLEELVDNGITAVLNVAWDANTPFFDPHQVRTVRVGLVDSSENELYMKDLAAHTLKVMLRNGEKVYVHCVSGVSRSVYIIARALCELEGRPIDDVFQEIVEKRPEAVRGPLFS